MSGIVCLDARRWRRWPHAVSGPGDIGGLNNICLLILTTLLLTVCLSHIQVEGGAQVNTTVAPGLVKPLHEFMGKLITRVCGAEKPSKPENVVVSPVGIHKSLSMLVPVAATNSATRRELLELVGYAGLSEPAVQKFREDYAKLLTKFESFKKQSPAAKMTMPNKTGVIKSTDPLPVLDTFNAVVLLTKDKANVSIGFRTNVEHFYHSFVSIAHDSNSRELLLKKFSNWTRDADYEKPLLSERDLVAKSYGIILTSATRLQALWSGEFNEHEGKQIFHNHGLRTKSVDGKTLTGHSSAGWKYLRFSDSPRGKKKLERESQNMSAAAIDTRTELNKLRFKMIQLPLDSGNGGGGGGNLSLTLFVPLDYSAPGDNKLNKLISKLFARRRRDDDDDDDDDDDGEPDLACKALELMDADTKTGTKLRFSLTMPKFKFEKQLNLNEILKSLGLQKALSESAEISDILERHQKLQVNSVLAQAMIDVGKMGIKATGLNKTNTVKPHQEAAPSTTQQVKVVIRKPCMFLVRYEKIPILLGKLTSL